MENMAILIGNLGKDPEVRHLENGNTVAQFSLATSETYKDKQGEKQTKTTWHNIVLWNGMAKAVEKYVKKGHRMHVTGKITNRSYQDADGVTRYITEIVGQKMTMLNSKSNAAPLPTPPEGSNVESKDEEDDLPF